MDSMLSRFGDREKAAMLEHIVNSIVIHSNEGYPVAFKSLDEYIGNITRTTLRNNQFIKE